MKLYADEQIRRKVATFVGTLTEIDWANGTGKAELDQPQNPPSGQEWEPVVVECRFRYAGQHWIWNQADPRFGAMDVAAYPEEDAASHSAFAFCVGDRVILLHKDKEVKEGEGQGGQNNGQEDDGKEYVAVAVLEEKEIEDGQGGTIMALRLRKRKVWPLYRLGHEALVLNFRYQEEENKGLGFPFVTDDGGRIPINAFLDWKDHVRVGGTIGGTGNPRVVVTRETRKEKQVNSAGVEEEVDVDVYIPHAIHEFCEADEDMPYVPDIYMQTEPNWKGRVFGWSKEDEVLLDNIPLARVVMAANLDLDELITPSWRSATRRIIHINEKARIMTVLHVTVDCHYDWRNGDGGSQWLPPKYAFHVLRGQAAFPCIYEAIEMKREELPAIELREDLESSWLWTELKPAVEEKTWLRDTQIDNLSGDALLVVQPDKLDVDGSVIEAGTAEIWFWGGCKMFGVNSPSPRHDKRCRIALVFGNKQDDGSGTTPDVGSLTVEKRIGDPEPWSPFNVETLESAVRMDRRDPEYADWGYVLEDHAEILGDEEKDEEGNVTGRSGHVEEEAARVGDNALIVRMAGHDHFIGNAGGTATTCDAEMTKTYLHRTPGRDYDIAVEMQRLTGSGGGSNIRGTFTSVIFTHINVRNGVYGFWEATWFDDAQVMEYIVSSTTKRPPTPWYIKWRHYLWSKNGKTLTHSFDYEIPFCLRGPYASLEDAPRSEIERSFVVRALGVMLSMTGDSTAKKWPVLGLWDVPRLVENNTVMEPSILNYNFGWPFTFAPVYRINSLLDEVGMYRGSKRNAVHYEQVNFVGNYTGVSYRPSTFALHPFPNKNPWIWPHFRNLCRPEPWGDTFRITDIYNSSGEVVISNINRIYDSGVAGVLYSESMGFDGFAVNNEFYYWVTIKGVNDSGKAAVSPGMERLLSCTGRSDAVISLD